LIVLVPGGAFGPSKCWPAERFAETADRLAREFGATVVVSVASNAFERQIAQEICARAQTPVLNLAERPVSLGELKALLAEADLVIANDTGPRHIAIALGRKVITLFGPNDPAWTQTGYANEVQIVGEAPCAPCQKPRCTQTEHTCMRSIRVQQVCEAVGDLLYREC
jgi:heptosyltransferase-2